MVGGMVVRGIEAQGMVWVGLRCNDRNQTDK